MVTSNSLPPLTSPIPNNLTLDESLLGNISPGVVHTSLLLFFALAGVKHLREQWDAWSQKLQETTLLERDITTFPTLEKRQYSDESSIPAQVLATTREPHWKHRPLRAYEQH